MSSNVGLAADAFGRVNCASVPTDCEMVAGWSIVEVGRLPCIDSAAWDVRDADSVASDHRARSV